MPLKDLAMNSDANIQATVRMRNSPRVAFVKIEFQAATLKRWWKYSSMFSFICPDCSSQIYYCRPCNGSCIQGHPADSQIGGRRTSTQRPERVSRWQRTAKAPTRRHAADIRGPRCGLQPGFPRRRGTGRKSYRARQVGSLPRYCTLQLLKTSL